MKVFLTNDGVPCGYALIPCNKRLAKKIERETGDESVIFQTDWDFPGLARSLGWRGKVGRERCEHRGTDGTVDCPDCGKTASQFISAASNWLDERLNTVFRKEVEPYFGL